MQCRCHIGVGRGGEGEREETPFPNLLLSQYQMKLDMQVLTQLCIKNCNLCVFNYSTAIIRGCIQLDKLTRPKHLFLIKVGIQCCCLIRVTDIHM